MLAGMLSLERNGAIVVATLARPPVNALDDELLAALEAVVDQVAADAAVTVLHFRSDQKAFCAGADLALMRSCFATRGGVDAMIEVVRRMQRRCGRGIASRLILGGEVVDGAEAERLGVVQCAHPRAGGFAAEFDGTRLPYEHAETRRRVADFLDRSAA
jgi:enoyl-CoA hydratase/carnithine racemase